MRSIATGDAGTAARIRIAHGAGREEGRGGSTAGRGAGGVPTIRRGRGPTRCAAGRTDRRRSRARDGGIVMSAKRRIEVFSAGCPACEETIALVNRIACPSCEVQVLDMRQPAVAAKAKTYGIRSVPAVVIDGKLADCCAGRGPEEAALRAAGLGRPLP